MSQSSKPALGAAGSQHHQGRGLPKSHPPSSSAHPTQPESAEPTAAAPSAVVLESSFNLPLLDPSRWGWTAAGGIEDLSPPHERARRKASKKAYLKLKRKRESYDSRVEVEHCDSRFRCINGTTTPFESDPGGPHNEFFGTESLDDPGVKDESHSDTKVAAAAPSKTVSKKRSKGTTDSKSTSKATTRSVRFTAWSSEGVLDMHTYHRGREGLEYRDEETGDLLCDVEATDTSYGKDAPKLVAPVIVDFPLEDDADDASLTNMRRHREHISWDLGDPETPTPMLYATDIATKFGLTYPQILDLAESIQNQLQMWVRNHCGFSQPLILKDTLGAAREAPSSVAYSLYGGVVGAMPGGMPLSTIQLRKKPAIRAATTSRSTTATATTDGGVAAASGAPNGQKAPAKRRKETKPASSSKADAKCLAEVRKRLRDESENRIKCTDLPGSLIGEIGVTSNVYCHACQDLKESGGTFACGLDGHAYCDAHLLELHNLSVASDPVPLMLELCPVCALECPCGTCSQRLEALTFEFKMRSQDQGVQPAATVFENLLDCSIHGITTEDAPKRKVTKKRRSEPSERHRRVKKLPVLEFPREVCNGADLDPGTELDYRTVYSSAGISVLSTATGLISASEVTTPATPWAFPPLEDGSIDYCLVCLDHGNLLCCDFCPRAFHAACIEYNGTDDRSDTPWECFACQREKLGIPEEILDGSKSLTLICAAYDTGSDSWSSEDLVRLRVLSIIHEMVTYLMDYTFGSVFREPVDPLQVPGYTNVIQTPMDLGTIATSLEEGRYALRLGREKLDAIIAAVLKDVELVWHNCFTFNFAGSAIYRMAEVQRRAAIRIQAKSFDSLLSESVKREVSDFIASCQRQREQSDHSLQATSLSSTGTSLPVSPTRNKISISSRMLNSKHCRQVAVLDPDTGMVVKIYTSLQAACAALELFLSLKYDCEIELAVSDMYNKVRQFVKKSAKNPRLRMFGYRWLWLDELRNRKVTIQSHTLPSQGSSTELPGNEMDAGDTGSKERENPTPPPEPANDAIGIVDQTGKHCIEMVDNGSSVMFDSIDDAITHSFESEVDKGELRLRLELLSAHDGGAIDFAGRKWRKVYERIEPGNSTDGGSVEHVPPISSLSRLANLTNGNDFKRISDICVFKFDAVNGRLLAEYSSVEDAFLDWLKILDASPGYEQDRRSMEVFRDLYLDAERSIDGLMWTTKIADRLAFETIGCVHVNGALNEQGEFSKSFPNSDSYSPTESITPVTTLQE